MPGILLNLLALFAFVLMPLGMGPVAAAPTQQAVSSMANHCRENSGQQPRKATPCTDCAAACSVTVGEPAMLGAPIVLVPMRTDRPRPRTADGLHPEAAIPPPRLA